MTRLREVQGQAVCGASASSLQRGPDTVKSYTHVPGEDGSDRDRNPVATGTAFMAPHTAKAVRLKRALVPLSPAPESSATKK